VLDLGEDIRDGSYREMGQISGGGAYDLNSATEELCKQTLQ